MEPSVAIFEYEYSTFFLKGVYPFYIITLMGDEGQGSIEVNDCALKGGRE